MHATDKPNVIIIITDQQRADAVGYINPIVQTPCLTNLARNSIVCTNAFVQSPQCQPSRASILTGRYPTAHRVWWNETKLSLSEKTIGNYFQRANYQTGYFGKLHVDGDADYTSIARHFGFKTTYLSEDWQSLVNGKFLRSGKNAVSEEFFGPMGTKTWTGKFSDRAFHHEDVITTKAIEFIKSQSGPYLAVVSYNGPHPPYAAPSEFNKLYDSTIFSVPDEKIPNQMGHVLSSDEWRELKKQYYSSISWIDDNVSKILQADPQAIVVFLSDHGDILGDHGLFSKGIFAYDGNIKIPLLFYIPGYRSVIYTHLVQAIDILPTLLHIVGIDGSPAIQGKSLFNHFRSNAVANKYVVSMLCHNDRLRMIRTDKWKYWICGQNEFLYDLLNDPLENENIASSDVDALHNARFQLLRALIKCEDPLPFPRQH